jgi:hypothetical protein
MYVNGRIEVRGRDTFFVHAVAASSGPVLISKGWRVECPPDYFEHGAAARLRTLEWTDNNVVECGTAPSGRPRTARLAGKPELVGGMPDAAWLEESPIPEPKVRSGQRTRYNGTAAYPGWEKLTAKGWVPA